MRQSFPALLSCALLLQVLPGAAQAAHAPLSDNSCATSEQIPSERMLPLPSWKDGSARRAILAYVQRVSRCGSPDWIPPEERIAVLDNDGTLWPENPIPIQLAYLLDTLRDRVRQTPSLANDPAVSAVLRGDLASLLKGPGSEEAMGRDKAGKPEAIHTFIGRRPVAVFGNSDGDLPMLQYGTVGQPRPSLGLLLHHTDGQREYAYDAKPSSSGKLVEGLRQAPDWGWLVVDMARDWSVVFPPAALATAACRF